jgi:UTP--glucose-1-phosphate uridylyltransferase
LLQVRGHQRAPSGSREFKELTKRDAQIQLQHELDKLLSTVPDVRQPSVKKELDGFAQLFHRFLQEEGPSVDWERIEKLPENAVSHHRTMLSYCINFQHKAALNILSPQ